MYNAQSNYNANVYAIMTPIISIPKSSCKLELGGNRGEDYHIYSVDESDPELVTANFTQMTPNNFSRTGQTIDYAPTGEAEKTVTVPTTVTGATTDTTFTNESDALTWKIWGEDEENIYIISSEPTATKLPLNGAEGYNNGVYYNDLIAKNVYGTTEYEGAETRGLKIEDIEYILDTNYYNYTSYGNYKNKAYDIAKGGINFPVVWGEMGESQVAENRSKQSKTYSGTKTPITPIQPISNYWTFANNGVMQEENLTATAIYDLIATENNGYYWLSSRYAYGESATTWFFGMMNIRGNRLVEGQLYKSNNEATGVSTNGVRPVVTIPKTSCNIRPGGTNGENYHIEPKI